MTYDPGALAADLRRDEEVRRFPYDDATGQELRPGDVLRGNVTVGVGCNLSAGLSDEEVEALFGLRIRAVERDLDQALPWWRGLPEPAARGLANMAFNLGLSRLLGFELMLAALCGRRFKRAAAEALDSRWARQVGDRSTRIAELFGSCS